MNKITKKSLLYISFFIFWSKSFSQAEHYATGQLLHEIQKLKVLGSALYVAAHPDDENTLLITWLANEKKVKTGYFAFTRGDGGQNLIGNEQDEFVGLLRTHELLAARKVDGGEQFFSRANDFGFSKSTEEALEFWGKEQVLSDLVYRIRKFRPDVIITRFPPDSRAGHGHHSASSQLAELAFDAAADPSRFPEQLKELSVWQAKRLVWNYYGRNFSSDPEKEDGQFIKTDIGGFNPLLGESYGEKGSRARSQHRSQGFGSGLFRGERIETFRHTKGEVANSDLFDGIDLSWNKVSGGKAILKQIEAIEKNFKPNEPHKSVNGLLSLLKSLEKLPKQEIVSDKIIQLQKLIPLFAGIHAEVNAADFAYTPSDSLKAIIRVINRSPLKAQIKSIEIPSVNYTYNQTTSLENNKRMELPISAKLADDQNITQPYWLVEPKKTGYYVLDNEKNRNLPMSPAAVSANMILQLENSEISLDLPVNYKYVEPARGEIYKYLDLRPEITLSPKSENLIFNNDESQKLSVSVKAHQANQNATISLAVPEGWSFKPAKVQVQLKDKYEEKVIDFEVYPSKLASEGQIQIVGKIDEKSYQRGFKTISYEHIPELNTYPLNTVEVRKLDLKLVGKNVGYIMGAGDLVPDALKTMGYNVDLLTENDLKGDLSRYQAIVLGVRTFNTQEWLPFAMTDLLNYVQNGGNLICQYQTAGFNTTSWQSKMGPYPFKISRDRVTEENAEVRFLQPEHPLLQFPNKITAKDFEGWVQERGLYFSNEWNAEYSPILSMNDKGEPARDGSLLHAKYGKGNYIFTGLSLFRELPAGVSGAYRLLANMISMK